MDPAAEVDQAGVVSDAARPAGAVAVLLPKARKPATAAAGSSVAGSAAAAASSVAFERGEQI